MKKLICCLCALALGVVSVEDLSASWKERSKSRSASRGRSGTPKNKSQHQAATHKGPQRKKGSPTNQLATGKTNKKRPGQRLSKSSSTGSLTSQNSKTSSGDESKDLRRQLQEANTRLQKKEAELSAATGANTAEEIPADKKKGFDDAAAEVKRLEDLGSIRPLTAEETSKLKEADAVWEKILTQPDVKNTKTALKAQLESAKRRSNFPKADSPAVDKVTKKKLETTNTALRHTLTETYDAPVQTPATGIALNYNGLRALTPTDTELQQAKTALTANTSGATGLGAIFRKYTSQSDHDAELTAAICKVCSLDHVQSELATVQTAPNLVQLATWTTRRNTAGNLWTQTDFEKDIEKYLVLLCSDL